MEVQCKCDQSGGAGVRSLLSRQPTQIRPARRKALPPTCLQAAARGEVGALFPETTEKQVATGSSVSMSDTAPDFASWDGWHADGGEGGYDSETEGNLVREEDQAAEDSDVLLLLQEHNKKKATEP
jgi:hypothetical protein